MEMRQVTKYFGSVVALEGVSFGIHRGEVTCILGDNGAGKSTLVKILSGVFPPDEGELLLDGRSVRFNNPREAHREGIAIVYQDLALIPLMSVWRNFYLAQELTAGIWPVRWLRLRAAKESVTLHLRELGIEIDDPDQMVGSLSGGQRQALAIARAVVFGARVLILDEPTSALGVRQAGIVLKLVAQAKNQGRAVVLITHNPHHAYPVGDRFVLLQRGRVVGAFVKGEIGVEELSRLMAGGEELAELRAELQPGVP